MIRLDDIQQEFRGTIAIDEPMARHVTFRIGGNADIYLAPIDRDDAVRLFGMLEDAGTEWTIIGNGSNILVADEGIRGLVVNLEKGFHHLRVEKGEIVAGAGVKLAQLVNFAIINGYGGAEMLAGIPGTLGGAVIMNAGAYGGEISDYMTWIDIITKGEYRRITPEEAGFGYRRSDLVGSIVLEAGFRFPTGESVPLKKARRDLLVKRNAAQPVNWPNAGSIFKNPEGDYAARLIEACGLKGERIGGAEISELHANFIINVEKATAADVIALVEQIRAAVLEKFDVLLELEIKPLGFDAGTLQRVGLSESKGVRA